MTPSSRRHAFLALLVGGAMLGLPSCHQVTDYPPQPRLVSKAIYRFASVEVVWIKDVDEAAKACGDVRHTDYGCSKVIPSVSVPGSATCTIYAVQPKDFNDQPLLAILGHEFWHCAGATHG